MEAFRFRKAKKPLLETKPQSNDRYSLREPICCASERSMHLKYSSVLGLQKYSNSINTFSKHKDLRVK